MTPEQIDHWHKVEAFRRYIRKRKIRDRGADNSVWGRDKSKLFQEMNTRGIQRLEEEYPDFAPTYDKMRAS